MNERLRVDVAGAVLALFTLFGCDPASRTVIWEDFSPDAGGGFPSGPGSFPDAGSFDSGAIGDPRARFELGQLLFFDKELSGNRNISCATCHVPFLTTSETLPLSLGEGATGVGPTRQLGEGRIVARNTQDLFAHVPEAPLFWDGRVEVSFDDGTLQAPVPIPPNVSGPRGLASIIPLLARDEMLGQPGSNELADLGAAEAIWDGIVERLLAFPDYVQLFEDAFPFESPTIGHVGTAMAAFQAELWVSSGTRFEPGLPLSPLEQEGADLFFGDARCARCHNDQAEIDGNFYNLAVPAFGPGLGADGLDEGRAEVTGRSLDRFKFRTPPLLNVAFTPPYMHNGAYNTLREVIEHHLDPIGSLRAYDGASLPPSLRTTLRNEPQTLEAIEATADLDNVEPLRPLTSDEVDALVAFLETLTVETERTKGPQDEVPDRVPSGLPVDVWPGGLHPHR